MWLAADAGAFHSSDSHGPLRPNDKIILVRSKGKLPRPRYSLLQVSYLCLYRRYKGHRSTPATQMQRHERHSSCLQLLVCSTCLCVPPNHAGQPCTLSACTPLHPPCPPLSTVPSPNLPLPRNTHPASLPQSYRTATVIVSQPSVRNSFMPPLSVILPDVPFHLPGRLLADPTYGVRQIRMDTQQPASNRAGGLGTISVHRQIHRLTAQGKSSIQEETEGDEEEGADDGARFSDQAAKQAGMEQQVQQVRRLCLSKGSGLRLPSRLGWSSRCSRCDECACRRGGA